MPITLYRPYLSAVKERGVVEIWLFAQIWSSVCIRAISFWCLIAVVIFSSCDCWVLDLFVYCCLFLLRCHLLYPRLVLCFVWSVASLVQSVLSFVPNTVVARAAEFLQLVVRRCVSENDLSCLRLRVRSCSVWYRAKCESKRVVVVRLCVLCATNLLLLWSIVCH